MTLPRVSVCVVSWHRPAALQRCLVALGQLQYPAFEIVVVADQAGLDAVPQDAPVKRVLTSEANISNARNLGISRSAGEVVAFIDDDAVPEPTWLTFLMSPFQEPDISASTGFVRGRNGISWQWQGRRVNGLGETAPHTAGDALPAGWALKTEGTNMAVRREVLCALGGFDPAFRFFLDETDLDMRLRDAGYKTALVPEAEVHHGFLPSAQRRADRVPRDVFEIGASWAVFLGKHAPDSQRQQRLDQVQAEENRRYVQHLIRGGLEPCDVRRLRQRLRDGMAEGALRRSRQVDDLDAKGTDFLTFPNRPRQSTVLTCRPATARRMRKEAEARVRNGEIVTLFNLSATGFFHYVRFTTSGVWEQTGGVFGKSERTQPLFRRWSRRDRVRKETERVAQVRNIAT